VPRADTEGQIGESTLQWGKGYFVELYQNGSVIPAPPTSVDNRLAKFNLTAGAVQNSGITCDDSNNLTGVTSITVGNTGLVVGTSTPFSDSTGTLTLQNIDALDATTEATIEAAIDALANLTVLGSSTGVVYVTSGTLSYKTLGIANTNIAPIDHASVADNDYAKFTASGLEGREYSEVLSDIGAQASDASLTSIAGLTYVSGSFIALTAADTYTVRTYAETLSDIGALANVVEDTSPQLGGTLDSNSKQIRWSKGSDVASANALTLGADGNIFDITGTTAITSIGALAIGTIVKLHFDGILTLTHDGTNIILPGGASITTAAGDEAEFYEYASGDWICTKYTKADGTGVVSSSPSPRTSETKTANYTVTTSDGAKTIEMDNAAARIFTLPAASSAGAGFWVKLVKEGAGTVTIQTNGTDTIADSGAGDTLYNSTAGEAGYANVVLEVAYDAVGWLIVAGHGTWVTTD